MSDAFEKAMAYIDPEPGDGMTDPGPIGDVPEDKLPPLGNPWDKRGRTPEEPTYPW